MNRKFTNIIRFFLDECLPALIRDNKYFMYPFYFFAYRGQNIKEVMNFKANVLKFTDQQYQLFYSQLNSISRNRLTDINDACLDAIYGQINKQHKTLIDVGCGNGYLLKQLLKLYPNILSYGSDIITSKKVTPFVYIQANSQKLPFVDNSFDVVCCNHTLEHVINLKQVVNELLRVCHKKLIITIPCQRYYYYTLDEHIHFFTYKYQVIEKLGLIPENIISIEKLWNDWLIVIKPKKNND